MSWKKHFTVVSKDKRITDTIQRNQKSSYGPDGDVASSYASFLSEYYAGNPQRTTRYKDYDTMDTDSEINTSLDIIADFCTQQEEKQKVPFYVEYYRDATETEVEIINTTLIQWTKINKFHKRLWSIFRSAIKYGDCFFVRDPETFEWLWVDQTKVRAVVVDASQGKEPAYYIIDDIDFRMNEQVLAPKDSSVSTGGTGQIGSGVHQVGVNAAASASYNVLANSVIHLSMSEGMDKNWPFGNSILESVFKVYKQKELLEDAILIYRIQRAPERRIFYIDTGEMNPKVANAYVQRIKNEVHQKRIPNRTSGGLNVADGAYNPMMILDDYYFAQSSDGRGSKVDTLPGGDGISNINDLEYFDNKMKRGLGIPPSYLPSSDDGAVYNDGRVGAAFMQEYRFAKYCQRLQTTLADSFDFDFKLFIKKKNLNIDTSLFDIRFNEPQSFAKYRQIEIDSAQINVFSPIADVPFVSKRFALKRYLNWTEDEILENEAMWKEENRGKITNNGGVMGMADDIGLDSVGVRSPSGSDDFAFDDAEGGIDDAGAADAPDGGADAFDMGDTPEI